MLHIYYGKGKGKTSAALGLILRACGYNKRIVLFQFLKPKKIFCGEYASLKKFSNVKQIRFEQKHPIFMQECGKKQVKELKEHIQESLLKLKKIIQNKKFDILICDEILNIIHKKLIKEEYVVKMFKNVSVRKEIILTGRNKPKKLAAIADYITEFRQIKHPFQKGILARKSIEF